MYYTTVGLEKKYQRTENEKTDRESIYRGHSNHRWIVGLSGPITKVTNTLCCHYSQLWYKSMNHINFYHLFINTAMQEIKYLLKRNNIKYLVQISKSFTKTVPVNHSMSL